MPIRVTVWNEFLHEQNDEKVRAVYPLGIHQAIAEFLGRDAELAVRTATLGQPDKGLPQAVLDQTDVLLWWGHMGHQLVDDMVVERVYQAVLDGMGLIVLHSGHASKIFEKICGMPAICSPGRREEKESGCLSSIRPTLSLPACPSILRFPRRKCTVSTSPFRLRIPLFS